MSKHHHPHPLGRKHKHHDHDHGHEHQHAEPYAFDWLLDLLKKVMEQKPNERGIIKGDFTCQEASYFNQKINECRKHSGATSVDENEHNPQFTKQERNYAVKEIAKEIQEYTHPLAIVSKKPNEIIYGDAHHPEAQIKYTFQDGKWLITPGKNVDAVIIDPAGKVIEITPGPHIHQYGGGGNLMVDKACKGHHEEHGHSHDHEKHHHHKGTCSHVEKLQKNQHKHGHHCNHSHH